LELATEEAAITMVNYYSAVTPHLRNQPIYIQYSNHKELKTDNTLNQVSMYGCISEMPGTFEDSQVVDINRECEPLRMCVCSQFLVTFKVFHALCP
jgi:hypothetical protein